MSGSANVLGETIGSTSGSTSDWIGPILAIQLVIILVLAALTLSLLTNLRQLTPTVFGPFISLLFLYCLTGLFTGGDPLVASQIKELGDSDVDSLTSVGFGLFLAVLILLIMLVWNTVVGVQTNAPGFQWLKRYLGSATGASVQLKGFNRAGFGQANAPTGRWSAEQTQPSVDGGRWSAAAAKASPSASPAPRKWSLEAEEGQQSNPWASGAAGADQHEHRWS
ncbi:hypothetical protein [Corynebacterium heidelbergense]|uniref:Uncharacterized protein n=1 Tax=Corynebacterium heidelbergense TaxID=2055947 RepID=A0A364VAD3_9CORY|nr:hypothetical protein [Corynebacterium heidelbergense]RAV33612.1 hypothetical protein CWC39_07500 [Corynebacterium heidelbergense]